MFADAACPSPPSAAAFGLLLVIAGARAEQPDEPGGLHDLDRGVRVRADLPWVDGWVSVGSEQRHYEGVCCAGLVLCGSEPRALHPAAEPDRVPYRYGWDAAGVDSAVVQARCGALAQVVPPEGDPREFWVVVVFRRWGLDRLACEEAGFVAEPVDGPP